MSKINRGVFIKSRNLDNRKGQILGRENSNNQVTTQSPDSPEPEKPINNGLMLNADTITNNAPIVGGMGAIFNQTKEQNSGDTYHQNGQFSTNNKGNFIENFKGDINMTKNRNLKTGNVTGGNVGGRDASGVAAGKDITGTVAGGDIYGTVSTAISQLPDSPELEKPGIKELLTQLKEAIASESNLSEDNKEIALEELNNLTQVANNPGDGGMKKMANRAIQTLKGIFLGLPAAAKLTEIAKEILPALASKFGFE